MTTKQPKAGDRIDPASLIPDLTVGASTASFWYWIGLRSDCPLPCVHVGGAAFCRATEILRQPAGSDWNARTERIEHPGQIVRLTREQVERIAERMGRTILRTLYAQPAKNEGEDTGDAQPVRHCVKIQIPSAQEIEQMRTSRRTVRPFAAREGDEPLAKYAFMVLLNERRPKPRGQHDVAPTVAEVGIELPTEQTIVAAPTGGLDWDTRGVNSEADRIVRMERLLA